MWTHGEAYVKPSSAWRTGFFMYEGWPAQEDGTDSQSHPSRKTHDLLYPGPVSYTHLTLPTICSV